MGYSVPAPYDPSDLESAIGSMKNNIVLNAFRIAINGSLAGPQKYEDGFVDEFEDESGMDTGSCVNHAYDGTNDLYKRAAGGVDACSGGTPTATGSDVGYPVSNLFDGTTSVWQWTHLSAPAFVQYQLPAAKPITRYTIKAHTSGGTLYYPTAWTFHGSNNGADYDLLDSQTGQSFTTGEVKAYDYANATAYLYYKIIFSAYSDATLVLFAEFELIEFLASYTLISHNVTAESDDPVMGKLILLVDYNGETVTLNTDILGYISMDNGSNFDQVALSHNGLYETDKHLISGEVSLTARSDKEIVVKMIMDNYKDVYLEGWACFWEY